MMYQKAIPTGKLIAGDKEYWLLDNKPVNIHDFTKYGMYEFMAVPNKPLADNIKGGLRQKNVFITAEDGGTKEISISFFPAPRLITVTAPIVIEWGTPDMQTHYILCNPTDYSDIPADVVEMSE